MREVKDHYEEEYIYLGDVTHDAVLLAWGKFFFTPKWALVADKDILTLEDEHNRHTSIGVNCESYGPVTVEVIDSTGTIVQSLSTSQTFAWVNGLTPNTEYTYRVLVPEAGGPPRVWAEGHLWSYPYHDSKEPIKEMKETQDRYACRFRTFPEPTAHEDLTFAVIGDMGTGDTMQASVALALERLIEERDVRLVLMVGDTVYNRASGGSGALDSEWLTTFFQPYRTIIDRVPFYPCVGNHDTKEGFFEGVFLGEKQSDRRTLYDNLLVLPRFKDQLPPGREASITPGLFYRLKFGADIEFICLDTSKESTFSKRLFEHAHHKDWVQHTLTTPLGAPRWRIPFSHHPPYCKGPRHDEDETRLRLGVLPLCEKNRIRAFFSGHEHNFQCIDSPTKGSRVRCFISGGAGGFREKEPEKHTDGFLHSWGGNDRGHFLIVTISGNEMKVEPIGVKVGGQGEPLLLWGQPEDVDGNPIHPGPISVRAAT